MRAWADDRANTGDVLAASSDRAMMSSDLLQPLYPNLLHRRLPDLIGHPGRSVLRLFYLSSVALIYMDLFVPLSLNLISLTPLLATLRAACLGAIPV